MKSVVSEKGQVTIPKVLRQRLGIHGGVVLEFEDDHGRLIARKVELRDPVALVYGVLALPNGTDAYMKGIRNPGGVEPE